MKRKSAGLLALGAAVLLSPPALAWGQEGHEIIALIAAHDLTPKARAGVAQLLGGANVDEQMATVSTWADEVRPARRETAPWHFVDIPIGSGGYDAARDCPQDNCVVAQIEHDFFAIANTRLSLADRVEALKFLIHFVGDIHQPLHAANHSDRGGNDVHVQIGGASENLHHVWDTDVVEALGNDPHLIAADLEARINPAERELWGLGLAVDRANDSFGVANREIYAKMGDARSIDLPDGYAASESAVVRVQLEKAGVRLAEAINAAFK